MPLLRYMNCFVTRAFIAVLCICDFSGLSLARDGRQYQQISRDLKAWVDGLTDQAGAHCCSDADGSTPEEVDWDMGAKHYRVKVDGEWIEVPDIAVIKGPNYLGHAVVWVDKQPTGDEEDAYVTFPYIRCFLPGPAI